MGITPKKIARSELSKYFAQQMQRINSALLMELQNVGEMCVNHAREIDASSGFMDQTGNLRASIGYVIYANGKPIRSNFKDHQGPDGNNGEGKRSGEALAKEVAGQYSKGLVLVVVAGMEYAHYVEAMNRDVLSSAEHLADKLVPSMLKKLSKNINRMKL